MQVFPSVRVLLSTSWDHNIRQLKSKARAGEASSHGTEKRKSDAAFQRETVIGILSSEKEAANDDGGNGGGGVDVGDSAAIAN